MSKVTIRFWNKKYEFYDESDDLVLDRDMSAYTLLDGAEVGYWFEDDIEPHFFVNGERIA